MRLSAGLLRPRRSMVLPSTKFELVINLKMAKTLGIKSSENVLSVVDEVID
jgi:ABC-type uncharacterized transport system substrate-binding protein